MCSRFITNISSELLAKIFELQEVTYVEPRYNISPTQQVWVVRRDRNHNRLDQMKWGLIPSGAKDSDIASHAINGDCETVAETPAFSHAIKHQRCIVPAAGFYEWHDIDDTHQPYFIRMVNSGLMAFAGLWEQWKQAETDDFLYTFTILTTESNETIAPIHNRMPLILHPEDYNFWLDINIHDPEQLQRLYKPFPADCMTAYKVPNLVNNLRFDSQACIVQV